MFIAHPAVAAATPAPDPGPLLVATIADRPLVVLAVVVGWIACGVAGALVMARRGHVTRPLVALGIVFGPLFVGFALVNLVPREHTVGPVVLREPRPLDGDRDVTVAVLGDPAQVIDPDAIVEAAGSDIAQMELVWPVMFETADEDDVARNEAAALLEDAARGLARFGPGLVLVPGAGTAPIRRYVEGNGRDVLIAAGDPNACTELTASLPGVECRIVAADTPQGRA